MSFRFFGICLSLVIGGVATGPVLAAMPASTTNSKTLSFIADLGSASFRQRESAMKGLELIGLPAVETLLLATRSRDAEVVWRSKVILISLAAKHAAVRSRLLVIWDSGRSLMTSAMEILRHPQVRNAHRQEMERDIKQLLARTHSELKSEKPTYAISFATRAAELASRLNGSDLDEQLAEVCVAVFERTNHKVLGFQFPAALHKKLVRRLVRKAIAIARPEDRRGTTGELETALQYIRLARATITEQQRLEGKLPNHRGFEGIEALIYHLAGPSDSVGGIGCVAVAALQKREENLQRRDELMARLKELYFLPVNAIRFGIVRPIYSSDSDIRARRLIFHSEDLRYVPEIWELEWEMEMPDLATPYRVHGGVI